MAYALQYLSTLFLDCTDETSQKMENGCVDMDCHLPHHHPDVYLFRPVSDANKPATLTNIDYYCNGSAIDGFCGHPFFAKAYGKVAA